MKQWIIKWRKFEEKAKIKNSKIRWNENQSKTKLNLIKINTINLITFKK